MMFCALGLVVQRIHDSLCIKLGNPGHFDGLCVKLEVLGLYMVYVLQTRGYSNFIMVYPQYSMGDTDTLLLLVQKPVERRGFMGTCEPQ